MPPEWLEESIKQKKFLDEKEYVVFHRRVFPRNFVATIFGLSEVLICPKFFVGIMDSST